MASERPAARTTWRAIGLGLMLAVPHGYFSIQTPTPTTVSLIYTVVLTLVPLLALNAWLRQRGLRPALTRADLLTIYTMLSISVAVAGHDVMQVLAPVLGHAFWFATPENQWQTLFHHRLPDWLVVKDMTALTGLYEGESVLWTGVTDVGDRGTHTPCIPATIIRIDEDDPDRPVLEGGGAPAVFSASHTHFPAARAHPRGTHRPSPGSPHISSYSCAHPWT